MKLAAYWLNCEAETVQMGMQSPAMLRWYHILSEKNQH